MRRDFFPSIHMTNNLFIFRDYNTMNTIFRLAILVAFSFSVFIIPNKLHAQIPTGITAFVNMSVPSSQVDEGIGYGFIADYQVYRNVFLRGGYNYNKADTNRGEFECEIYKRHYLSVSLMTQRRVGYAWYPFIDVGGGYYIHKLIDDRILSERECENEKLKNGFGFHAGTGLRVRITPNMRINFTARKMFVKSDLSRKSAFGGALNVVEFNKDLSTWQVEWGLTYLF